MSKEFEKGSFPTIYQRNKIYVKILEYSFFSSFQQDCTIFDTILCFLILLTPLDLTKIIGQNLPILATILCFTMLLSPSDHMQDPDLDNLTTKNSSHSRTRDSRLKPGKHPLIMLRPGSKVWVLYRRISGCIGNLPIWNFTIRLRSFEDCAHSQPIQGRLFFFLKWFLQCYIFLLKKIYKDFLKKVSIFFFGYQNFKKSFDFETNSYSFS